MSELCNFFHFFFQRYFHENDHKPLQILLRKAGVEGCLSYIKKLFEENYSQITRQFQMLQN